MVMQAAIVVQVNPVLGSVFWLQICYQEELQGDGRVKLLVSVELVSLLGRLHAEDSAS